MYWREKKKIENQIETKQKQIILSNKNSIYANWNEFCVVTSQMHDVKQNATKKNKITNQFQKYKIAKCCVGVSN